MEKDAKFEFVNEGYQAAILVKLVSKMMLYFLTYKKPLDTNVDTALS